MSSAAPLECTSDKACVLGKLTGVCYRVAAALFFMVLLFLTIPLFVPFTPKMPAIGIDSSWAFGLNQAVAQGLAFGKEIIFTLGPYAAIYTKSYHPATDAMMLWGSLYLALSYWLALVVLMRTTPWFWNVLFSLFLGALVYSKDSLFFSYPLLLGLILCTYLTAEQQAHKRKEYLLLALLSLPMGLLPLIKGSFLILSLVVILLNVFLLLSYRYYLLALVLVLAPCASMTLFWLLSGQNSVNLSAYLVSSFLIATSFTQAMSTQGSIYEVLAYIATGLLILLSIRCESLPKRISFFLLSLYFVFLLLSFKAGFTRHFGHALIASTSILFSALSLLFCMRKKLVPLLVIAFALLVSLYIEGHYTQLDVSKNCKSTYLTAWHGLRKRIDDKNWLQANFYLTLNFLKTQSSLPVFSGTSDIYSFNQTELIASGNHWNPRPVLQSYSAFNSTLLTKNDKHLQGVGRPDAVFFKIQPIDNRLPSLEDGISWHTLLTAYRPKLWANEFLVLSKQRVSRPSQIRQLTAEEHVFGESVSLPSAPVPIFVDLTIEPTLYGMLLTWLFKPNELYMELVLANHEVRHFRVIPQMAKSMHLLSPLIENTTEFAHLYQQNYPWKTKQVLSFTLKEDGAFSTWKPRYRVHFKTASALLVNYLA